MVFQTMHFRRSCRPLREQVRSYGAVCTPVGVSLLTKALAQTPHFPESVPASSRTSERRPARPKGACVPLWE
ncbi:hypothetical protein CCL13_21110 [Pseudomonas syringae]|nr:hypothetical protein CCL13_21110 [Pseudomonas syringae]